MIKRLVVFIIFVFQTMSAMHIDNKPYKHCLGCREFFDVEGRRRVLLTCCQTAQQLLVTNPRQESLRDECDAHSLCLTCLRKVLMGSAVFCPSCEPKRQITLDEVYEIEAISLDEYYGFFIRKFGFFVWKRLVEAKRIIDEFDEHLDNNIHPLAIELSALLD
jgi:hypothetical protein